MQYSVYYQVQSMDIYHIDFVSKSISFYFKRFAFYNYLICFILEWVYQYKIFLEYYFDSRSFGLVYRIGFIMYIVCIHMIMYDDIKLIQFLRKDARVRILD